ncbi:hypothetical protein EMCRGX_G010636 [Ephydatia muelleri]
MTDDESLRKTLSEEEVLHMPTRTQFRSRENSLDVAALRPGFKLPTLATNERAVLPQIKKRPVLLHSKEELRRKLLRCFKLVRLLALIELQLKSYARYDGCSKLLKDLSRQSSDREFTVNQTLAFNKASFFAHNTNYVPHWAIHMLSKPSSERSSCDIHHLALLLRTMKFFGDDFTWEHLLEICRHCEYSKYEKERVILKAGHIPYYCYLIFSGSVHVKIAKELSTDGVKVPSYTQSILRKGAIFGVRWEEWRWEELRWEELRWEEVRWEELRWEEWGWEELRWEEVDLDTWETNSLCIHHTWSTYEAIVCASNGSLPSVYQPLETNEQTFDSVNQFILKQDVAVIHNVRRTATVICQEDVECLLVDEDTCRKIFPEEKAHEFDTKMRHLKDSGLLDGWPHDAISKMTIHSHIFRTYYGEVLEVNTAQSEFIYIVTKGRVDVILQVGLTSLPRSCKAPSDPASKLPVVGGAQRDVFVCVDHLTPYQCCDLSSLLDDVLPPPFTLVSRGAEILKIPKIRLHTTAPLSCWKALLLKAAIVPKYPASEALHGLIADQLQWYAYKRDVLSDVLGKDSRETVAMTLLPPVTAPLKLLPSLEDKFQQ